MYRIRYIMTLFLIFILSGCSQEVSTIKVNEIDALESFSEGYSFYGCRDRSEGPEAIDCLTYWGVMDENGNKITECIFSYHSKFKNELAQISENQSGMLIGYVNTSGEVVIEPIFTDASDFEMGLAAVKEKEAYYGYINTSGEYIIEPQYFDAYPFSEQLAAVNYMGKWGYIDTNGKVIIPFQYKKAQSFNGGLAYVKNGDVNSMIDAKGNVVIDDVLLIATSSEDRLIVIKNKQVLLLDSHGNLVKNLGDVKYEKEEYSVNNDNMLYLSRIQVDTGIVFYRNQNHMISEGKILFGENNKYGFLDLQGNIIIDAQFEWASQFENGYAIIKSGDSYGYIDTDGKIVVEPKYDFAQPVSEDKIAIVYEDGRNVSMLKLPN